MNFVESTPPIRKNREEVGRQWNEECLQHTHQEPSRGKGSGSVCVCKMQCCRISVLVGRGWGCGKGVCGGGWQKVHVCSKRVGKAGMGQEAGKEGRQAWHEGRSQSRRGEIVEGWEGYKGRY